MSESQFTITVHQGTCGIATGAKETLAVFQSLLPNATYKTVGCRGICHQEVVVEVLDEHGNNFMYGKVSKEVAPKIVGFHTGKEALPKDNLILSNDDTDNIKGQYLKKQTRIALRNVGLLDPTSIRESQERDGYQSIQKILKNKITPEQVIEEVRLSGIRGRGGAGFSTFQKWLFARSAIGDKKYLICNGDEGDPGAFMDRSLLEGDPHNVLEGMLIAAYAIGATEGYAYIRAEYPLAVKNFDKAIHDAKEAGLLGKNILGSSFSFDIKVKQGAGAFVCGEETALIASIEGGRGMPRIRPPFPAIKGLFGKPTIINNVETLANLAWIIQNGGRAYAKYGTPNSKGTKVFALAGAIARGGLVEIPMGMTLREVIYDIGGGSKTGLPIKAVQLGGPSGGCVPRELFDTQIDYEAIGATGAIMGSGGMVVMDDSSCMVDIAKYFLNFTQLESCGKCTFCRVGSLRMRELLTKISDGQGTMDDLETLEDLAKQVKTTSLCGLGQTAPNPVITTLKYFRDEYIAHIKDQKCPAGVCKKLIQHTIQNDRCVACGICAAKCPVAAITGTRKQLNTFKIDRHTCINCGMCIEVCPHSAIKVD